eukprot:gene4728-5073_t
MKKNLQLIIGITMVLLISMIRARYYLPSVVSSSLKLIAAIPTRGLSAIDAINEANDSLTVEETVAYQGFRNIVKRNIKLPNDKIIEIEVLKHRHESVVVFSWNSTSKTTTLVREYHPGPELSLYGTVAGMYEKSKHHSALECAEHELEEEAQLRTSKWYTLLGSEAISMPFDKYSNNRFYPFLALDCEKVENGRPLDEGEYITIHENVTYQDIMKLIETGKMNVVSTYTCLLAFKKLDELGIAYK